MEENNVMEVEEVKEEIYEYEDPCAELEELAANEVEEPTRSSGAGWMALGAAIVIGGYVGGKWVYNKGKKFIQKKLDERAAKKQEYVDDSEIDESNIVDEE